MDQARKDDIWWSYDRIAESYDRIAVPHYFAPVAQRLISLVRPSPRDSMLDVGSGSGLVASAALEVLQPNRVVAADLSSPMLLAAKNRGVRTVVAANLLHLPFGDECFDCITASFVVNHIANCAEAASEMVRLIRPGGKLGLTSWAFGPSENEIGKAWNEITWRYVEPDVLRGASDRALPSEARLSDRKALASIIREAGLSVTLSQQVDFPIHMSTTEYIDSRCNAMASRFMISVLPAERWEHFVQTATTTLNRMFGDSVSFLTKVNFVVAQKSASSNARA